MNNDINLLHSKKRSVLGDLTTKLRFLRFGATLLLSLVVLLSMSLFFLVLASPLPQLKEQEDTLVASLATEHTTIAQYTLLTMRLNEIRTVTNKRMKMKETVTLFRTELPSDVTIKSMAIEDNVIRMRATSLSLKSLQNYLETLKKYVKESKSLQLVRMNSLTLTDEGYELDVTATL